jgi:anti-anti-sigma factor
VIAPVGELDLHTVRALTQQLDEAVGADRPQVALNLSAVTLVDSTALGAITLAERHSAARGDAVGGGTNGSAAAALLN